jgi:cytochrome P450
MVLFRERAQCSPATSTQLQTAELTMNFTDFSTPDFIENPYPVYEKVRAAGPLLELKPNMFITAGFNTVSTLLRDRRMGKDFAQSVEVRYGHEAMRFPAFDVLGRTFLMLNPPAHTKLRALLTKAFNARQIENMRAISQATSQQLIDRIDARDEFDLVRDYAVPLPVEIICRLLDIPSAHGIELGHAATRLVASLDFSPVDDATMAAANEAATTLDRYFREVVHQRRQHIGDDLISALVSVHENGATLTDDEIVANAVLMYVAGHETTSNMIGNAFIALFRHPDQLHALKHNPALIGKAVAECMRYDSSVQMVVRTAQEDMLVEGVKLARGDAVNLFIAGANRDPAVFRHPDHLDFGRPEGAPPALTFGGGIHYCLGARLAVLEIEVAINNLLAHFPEMQILNLDRLEWHPRQNLRGVRSLQVATRAASAKPLTAVA